jgi:phosphoglycolate phosphatase
MYHTILFDLDGTLSDPREGIYNAMGYCMKKLNRPCPGEETLRRFVGPPLHDSFMEFCGMSEEEAWEAVAAFREWYIPTGWAENKPLEGGAELLSHLKAAGCKTAIASSKPERSVVPIAKKFGFLPYLDAACGSDGINESKTDVIRDALARLHVSPEEMAGVVMVGDRKFDVAGARECGLPCVGVTFYDFAPPGELEEAGAIAVCSTVTELEHFLLK